jgi:hypothetical protein
MSTPNMEASAPHPTYGELMDTARIHATTAQRWLRQAAFANNSDALAAVDARGRLLRSLAANARAVLGPVRVDAVLDQRPTRHTAEARTPRTLATLRWLDRLQVSPIVDATEMRRATGGGAVTCSLRAARTAVDAATDLALTHYDPPGRLREDASDFLTAGSWGELTADCMRLVAVAAAVEPLAHRCRQAGLTRAQVDQFLPIDDGLIDQTWTLAASWRFPIGGARDLTLANPALRIGDPAAEWTDRMAAVHQQMRVHHERGRIGVRTLRDVARLGTVISHVLATSGQDDAAAQSRITTQWQALTEYLAPLRSTEPANDEIRGHVESMLDIASASHAAVTPAQKNRLVAAIVSTTPVMDECSALAQALATTSNDLWLPPKPRRPYLRVVPAANTRARQPTAAPHPWPRPIRAGRADRSVGLS